MKKSMFLLAMMVLLMLLAAPMVLAQEDERCPGMPDVPCRVDSESGLYQILYTVYCGTVTGDPADSCTVDQNGLITLPNGTKAPYTAAADFINGPDGLYQFVDVNTAQFIVLTVTARRLGLHTNNLRHLIVRPHEGRSLNRVYLNCSWSPCGG